MYGKKIFKQFENGFNFIMNPFQIKVNKEIIKMKQYNNDLVKMKQIIKQ